MTTGSNRIGGSWAALAAFTSALALAAAGAGRPAAERPRYTGEGKLELPAGYRTWVFVGANLSPEYKSEADAPVTRPRDGRKAPRDDQFHHIYINPESYDAFREKGEFPDPTMLVLEIFRAETRDSKGILTGGKVEGRRVGLSVAVKDSRRPGGGVPWAYYSFDVTGNRGPVKPAPAHADRDCYACHLEHASKDNVWVQFYPMLRDRD
jgi:hypothetical protein